MRKEIEEKAEKIKAFLEDHKVRDVVVMDLTPGCSWTDCFVVGTVTSIAHLRGVVHQIWGLINELGLEVSNRHKSPGDDGWELIDWYARGACFCYRWIKGRWQEKKVI